jgi:hypothetical protein
MTERGSCAMIIFVFWYIFAGYFQFLLCIKAFIYLPPLFHFRLGVPSSYTSPLDSFLKSLQAQPSIFLKSFYISISTHTTCASHTSSPRWQRRAKRRRPRRANTRVPSTNNLALSHRCRLQACLPRRTMEEGRKGCSIRAICELMGIDRGFCEGRVSPHNPRAQQSWRWMVERWRR